MISHKHKFIFVHINKTAGTSIEKILKKISRNWIGKHHSIKKYYKLADKNHGFENYFKFTIIRNPWDRFLSLYKFRVFKNHTSLGNNTVSFKEWAKNIYDKNPKHYDIPNELQLLMLSEQLDWITDADGNIPLDFFVKFENLQQDFNTVCDKIGIPQQQLPHKNKTKHKHYTEYYDEETKQIVAEKYAKDIEYFGYKFGQ